MSEYEFNENENRLFFSFSKRLIYLSIALLFTGLITLIKGIIPPTGTGDIITGSVFIIMAIALFLPIQYFIEIIASTGNDMVQFVKGFKTLSLGMMVVIGAMGVIMISIIVSFFQIF